MQTFLPFASFEESARALDWRRLGKQRSETKILLNGGWQNHPASKMWRGHEYQLALYGSVICKEWIRRGYRDNTLPFFLDKLNEFEKLNKDLPIWFGNSQFHISHQSNLIRKLPEHYEKLFFGIPNNLPYIWPK